MSIGANQPSPLINPRFRPLVYTGAIATGLAATAALSPFEPLKIIGMTVLTGAGYGIANDMIACRDCIEYFTVGHQYDGKNLDNRVINTLDPNLNAIAWGVIATWHVCAVAGTFFAFIARTPFPGLALKISAAQIAPYLGVSAAIVFSLSHVKSRIAQKELANDPRITYYPGVPTRELQQGWHACNTRNASGYDSLKTVGIILSVAIIAARVRLITLPSF
jgi:hypothetical protein